MNSSAQPGEEERLFGDPVYVRRRLRRVIRRGEEILDQIEGARQHTEEEGDSGKDMLFADTAVFRYPRTVERWRGSLDRLVDDHLPFLDIHFDAPLPSPERGFPTRDFLAELAACVEVTIVQLGSLFAFVED